MPSAKRRPLEDAHRTVPEHRARARERRREAVSGCRPDVEAEPAVGKRVEGGHLALRVRSERLGRDDVGREHGLEGEAVVRAELLGHLAADEHGVRTAAEVLEDAELVLDLRAPGNEHERPLDVPEEAPEHLQLLLEEEAGVGGQQVRDAFRRRVRAVRGPERVVHVQVVSVGEAAGGLRVVLRLSGVEAGVLEHGDPRIREQLAEPVRDRVHRERRIGALRPAEMGADRDLRRVPVEQKAERRERGPDPRVVRDLAVLERDVEVGADEDALARDVRLAHRARLAHGSCSHSMSW